MLKKLQAHHREIARLKHQGYKKAEIAQKVDMAEGTLTYIFNDPLFQEHLASLEDSSDEEVISARKILADGAVSAAKKVVELIESYDEKLSLQASKDVLDRTGYAPAQQNIHAHAHYHLGSEEIEELKSRAKQAGGFQENELIDVSSESAEGSR